MARGQVVTGGIGEAQIGSLSHQIMLFSHRRYRGKQPLPRIVGGIDSNVQMSQMVLIAIETHWMKNTAMDIQLQRRELGCVPVTIKIWLQIFR